MTQTVSPVERWTAIDPRRLRDPAALIFNPHAGQKLGLDTNPMGPADAQAALQAEGIRFDAQPTRYPGHATELARAAVAEGRQLVIGAGGDGTINEVARGLANSQVTLGLMPLGSIMNVARTLWVPRDLRLAARTLAEGKVLAMDMGRVGGRYFLEAAGVGLDAGLFGYFDRLDSGASRIGVLRGLIRFLRQLGSPRISVEHDTGRIEAHAPMVSIANGPYVGAAYAIAPHARIDDGLLDVVVFRRTSIPRVLVHLALIAGGRSLPPPEHAATVRTARLRVRRRRGRPLPVHVDGDPIGVTPVEFNVAPGALRVITGPPDAAGIRAWEVVGEVNTVAPSREA